MKLKGISKTLLKVKFLDWHPPHWFHLKKLNRMFSICQGALKSELVLIPMMLEPNLKQDIHLRCKSIHKGAMGEGYPKKMAWHTTLTIEKKHLT